MASTSTPAVETETPTSQPDSTSARSSRAAYGAPELTDVGAGDRGAEYFANYVANPAQFGNTVMPPYAGLGEENLTKIAAFLDASKGPQNENE